MTTTAPLPPGPTGSWLTGNLREFHGDVLGFYDRMAREYGDVSSFHLGWRRLVIVADPLLAERILVTDAKQFGKLTYVLKLLQPLLGNGLLTSEGDAWLKHRRLIQPLFSKKRIDSYADVVTAYTRRLIDGWQDGDQRDIHAEMGKLALEVIAKVLFDADVANDAAHVGEALTVVTYNFLNRWGSLLPLPDFFPTPGNLRYFRSVRQLDEILYRFIRKRRESKESKEDLLSVLLQARDEDGESMSDKQLRDEAMTLFLAGHETTANAMGFTWYLLAQHPEVVEKVRSEVSEVVSGPVPTAADVAKLKYTEAVILESMRLYPPAYSQGRIPNHDMEMNGYRIPAHSTVLVSQWLMHRDARWWDNALSFWPERWLDGSTKNLPKFAYIPFGGGGRLCIGNNFAMMEAVLILATMIREVDMELIPEQNFRLSAGVVLKPEFGIQVKLHMKDRSENNV